VKLVDPDAPVRPRVVIANRRDGGVGFWVLRLYGFAALVMTAAIALTGVIIYSYFSLRAPPVPDFKTYAKAAPAVSRIYAADGTVLGEFAKEWREIVPFEKIPKQLVDAFLAVEDHDFYNHGGIYWRGIARAVWANVSAGDFAQGGSTITQQVAKQFLGNEKSLGRKGKEAIMARRLEARYSKNAILAVYLNHIYLGAGAWGVAAAAHRYFQKDLDKLTLAECAMIAGLAKAPSAFSPIKSVKLATERRNVVLDRMAQYDVASAEDVAKAKQEPIKLDLYKDIFPDRMPYYAEHVRRYVTDRYKGSLAANGLRIETAAEPTWEAAAYENADFGARHQDKRQGWRGPEWRVDGAARDTFIARQKKLYGAAPLVPNKRYLAVVDKVDGEHAEVLVGDRRLQLPLKNLKWASKWQAGNADNDFEVDSATAVLHKNDVVWVSREIRTLGKFRDWNIPDRYNPTWVGKNDELQWDIAHPDVVKLDQVPHPQTAIFTADHHTGYVAAMVGGFDYDRSVFNRAVQACRQPGSTYKPIYYSLGLDSGYGYDTVLVDEKAPIEDPDTGEVWNVSNLDDTEQGHVTLEYALVFSKNLPSIDLFHRLGAKNVEAWARRLGFTTKIFADDALALGASCSRLDEMARAFTIFARNGAWWPRPAGKEKTWVYVRRIVDRAGNTVEDATVADDPRLTAGDRLDRTAALAGIDATQAIGKRTGFLTSHLLQREVEYGFANVLRATELKAAGKTGTSSATFDTWFIGYTSRFTTLVWMGDDKRERGLGKTDAAYMTVVPLWSRYMYEAGRGYPNSDPYVVPAGMSASDRGDCKKGECNQMELIWHAPPKKKRDGDTPPA
jgi:penicillin-binding protein 1A